MPRKKTRAARFLISALATALAVMLVLLPPGYLPSLVSFSPLVAVGSLLSAGTGIVKWSLIPAALVLLLMFARHRLFCRFLCPLGFGLRLLDLLQPGRAKSRRMTTRLPNVGIILLVAAMITAMFHGPSLLWLDPLSLFSSAFCVVSFSVMALPVLIPVGLTLLFPGVWCAKTCPLGAMQDWSGRWSLAAGKWLRKHRSQGSTEMVPSKALGVSRRGMIKVALGVLFGGLLISREELGTMRTFARMKERKEGAEQIIQPFLRPPGAVAEPLFRSLCTRCGSCMRSCPSGVLMPNRESKELVSRSKGLLTPELVIDSDYCREDCTNCSAACPSGAIASFSVEEKASFPIGLAQLTPAYCLLYNNRECEICKRDCPYEAISFEWSEEEYLALPVIDKEKCTGCGCCQTVCPGSNDYERKKDPSLPMVKALRVVGFV